MFLFLDRFLDKDGKIFTPKSFMPFSVGRRVCLGDNLAKMELFMFLGGILQTLSLEDALWREIAGCWTVAGHDEVT